MKFSGKFYSCTYNIKNKLTKKIEAISVLSLFLLVVVIPLLLTISKRAYAEVPPPPVTPPTPPNSGTPTSTPIPTAEPSLTPTVTLTPTPVSNRSPVITTWFLPQGRVNHRYSRVISGFDWDKNDQLTMKITNLPAGVSQGACQQYVYNNKKIINCPVAGIPRRVGYYLVNILLTDNRSGTVRKRISLFIFP